MTYIPKSKREDRLSELSLAQLKALHSEVEDAIKDEEKGVNFYNSLASSYFSLQKFFRKLAEDEQRHGEQLKILIETIEGILLIKKGNPCGTRA